MMLSRKLCTTFLTTTRFCPVASAILSWRSRTRGSDEVRFSSEPKVDIRLNGCSVLDTVRVVERRNLPRPVQPNVTYRNVHIAVEILGHLDAQCLLAGIGGGAAAPGADSLRGPLPNLCSGTPADSAVPAPVRR